MGPSAGTTSSCLDAKEVIEKGNHIIVVEKEASVWVLYQKGKYWKGGCIRVRIKQNQIFQIFP